jgi:hypothetical protein
LASSIPLKSNPILNSYLDGIDDEFLDEVDDDAYLQKLSNNYESLVIKPKMNSEKLLNLGLQISKDFRKSPKGNSTHITIQVPLRNNPVNQTNKQTKLSEIITLNSDDNDESTDDILPLINDNFNDDDIEEIDDDELLMLGMKSMPNQLKLTKNDFIIPDLASYSNTKWLFNDIKDSSANFRSFEYPHTQNLLTSFHNLFGLKEFRAQQFEAINAALLSHNVFVLMPTGGGNSNHKIEILWKILFSCGL